MILILNLKYNIDNFYLFFFFNAHLMNTYSEI